MEENVVQEEMTLGQFLKQQREAAGMSMREMCRMTSKMPDCGKPISETAGYYSRVENDDPGIDPEKIGLDFLWAIGVVLRVDPLKLFVLSRKGIIPQRLVDKKERDKIFKVG